MAKAARIAAGYKELMRIPMIGRALLVAPSCGIVWVMIGCASGGSSVAQAPGASVDDAGSCCEEEGGGSMKPVGPMDAAGASAEGSADGPGNDGADGGWSDAGLNADVETNWCGTAAITCSDSACSGTALYTPCTHPGARAPVPPPVADDCVTSVVATDSTVFMCDGYSFTTSIPSSCVSTGCGLIFDMHGLLQTPDLEEEATELATLGQQYGYIVVQPAAPGGSWSLSDYPKVWSFLERVASVFHVDSRRIHFTGYSEGGDATWWALCNHSDVLASVAPNNMPNTMGPALNPGCFSNGGPGPAHQIPILYSFGASEPFATPAEYSSSVAAIQMTYGISGSGQPVATGADGKYRILGFDSPSGVRFEYMMHQYSGTFGEHCVAGGGMGSSSCNPPMDIHWGKYMMKFFIDHPHS
jgi:hypothetical protein